METVHLEGIGRFYKTPSGDFPSVTTVISGASDNNEWLQEWRERVGDAEADRIVKESTDIGTHLHHLFECFLQNQPIPEPNTPEETKATQMYRASKKKLSRLIDELVCMEVPVWSKEFRIAGRFDCLSKIKNDHVLIDFKNTRSVKKREDIDNYRIQLAFYRLMIKETLDIDVSRMIIFMVNREGFVQVFEFEPEETPRKELVGIRKKFFERYGK